MANVSPRLRRARSSRSRHLKEDAEQRAVIEWAQWIPAPGAQIRRGRKLGEFLLHIPNGGTRRPVEAAIFKALGVKSGVSDLLLALPCSGYPGLWIEMKRARGAYASPSAQDNAVTGSQRAWLALMEEAGYATAVAYGAAEAIHTIERYLAGRLRPCS